MVVQAGMSNIFGHTTPTSDQISLDSKREYNIKLRAERHQQRQAENALIRKSRNDQDAARREQRKVDELKKRQSQLNSGLQQRKTNMKNDYVEKSREAAIAKREKLWGEKSLTYIQALLDESQHILDERIHLTNMAKATKVAEAKSGARQRGEKKQVNEQMNEQRTENIRKRAVKRLQSELHHCDALKQEIEEEVEYKVECSEQGLPTRVTMNDLVKSLVPVPTISELFCAVRSERDETRHLSHLSLDQLQLLAALEGTSPLLYVKVLNAEHEKSKLPIPSAV